jgi:hypothetical protein
MGTGTGDQTRRTGLGRETGTSSDGEDEEDDWEPTWDMVPFGPFLALGALAALLFEPAFERLLLGLALLYRY